MDVAVVTGAGRGLGRAIAGRLADRGLAVVCADLDGEAAEAAAAEIGGAATGATLDVADPEACRAVARDAAARGRLAVWVNNAGAQWVGPFWDQPDDAVERLVRANLLGVIHGCRAAVNQMRERGPGRILNIASLAGLTPSPGFAVYGATKHGVIALTAALDLELRRAGLNVSVRALCPDAADTRMVWDDVDKPDIALVFSAPKILSTDEVAQAAIRAIDGDRAITSVPRYRGAIARAMGMSPAVMRRGAPLFLWIGERSRKRQARSRAGA